MKIALVVTGGLHPSGRIEVVPAFLWLIERLARTHDVHAFALRHLRQPTTYRLAAGTIHDLGRPRGQWRQWRALRQALQAYGPFDVIHGFWPRPAGALAAAAGWRLRIPSVVTCDSGEFTALPAIGYGLQLNARGRITVALACRLATRVHVTSAFMEAQARRAGYHPIRIPIGIDRSRLPVVSRPHDGPPWRLLQVATLSRVKDQATLLRALAIARQSLDVRLDLVGEDTLGGQLQADAAMLGVRDAVVFHGLTPHDQLGSFHRTAHLYVQSSLHEAGGVAVLEAAAAGLPVVGTRVGSASDLAPDGVVAVAPGDAAALAAAIVDLLQHPQKRAAIAAIAQAFAVSHDADFTARELVSLYESIVAGGAADNAAADPDAK